MDGMSGSRLEKVLTELVRDDRITFKDAARVIATEWPVARIYAEAINYSWRLRGRGYPLAKAVALTVKEFRSQVADEKVLRAQIRKPTGKVLSLAKYLRQKDEKAE